MHMHIYIYICICILYTYIYIYIYIYIYNEIMARSVAFFGAIAYVRDRVAHINI